ncbi:hypothetical protein QTQ03_24855 [Micromonospora sp. WMMA1363]|uniref:hypothetical protein n=1 Tax=Micromonospora sp. WMMA1363 TaxID=3053985 RepID=UPI00259CF195|nr:hypothetical protein [Micromonospora sp. WMMA1363]MDM4722667.1 hypothetical protein [Micromonospora sp. WMMA1363]
MTVRVVVGVDLYRGEPARQAEDRRRRDGAVLLDQLTWWGWRCGRQRGPPVQLLTTRTREVET